MNNGYVIHVKTDWTLAECKKGEKGEVGEQEQTR